jgi:hypothetical protein
MASLLCGKDQRNTSGSSKFGSCTKIAYFRRWTTFAPGVFAEVIRRCWKVEYESISALECDLDEISPDPSLEMSNGVGGAQPKVPLFLEL